MTTARRFWWGFGTLIVVLVITALGTLLWLYTLKSDLHDLTSMAGPRSSADYVMGAGMGVLKYIETGDPAYREQVIKEAAEFARFKAEYDRLAQTPKHRELGERVSTLFGESQALGETLMNTKDRQQALFTALAQSFDAIDTIIDDKLQAKLRPAGPDGPLKVLGMAYLDADIAEVGSWLGNYLHTSNPLYKERMFEKVEAAQKELKWLKTLRLTRMERRWVGELENRYAQALSQVQAVIALHESQRSDERRFLDLLAQLDRQMDRYLHIKTERELTAAQGAVQAAVNRILASALILFGVGITIALGTGLTVGRSVLKMENARPYEETRQRDRGEDEFLATLADRLRNLLVPIGSALEILRQGNSAASAQARETIKRQFWQSIRLVDDLLDVSRIIQGRIELRRERVALVEIIQGALETSRPLIERYGHELTVTLPPDPVWLEVDSPRLAQSIANLLGNAAKYTPERGHITLIAEREGGNVTIRVRDTGIGIPAEMLSQVFGLFAQVDTAIERAQGGLGIGLFLVKRLIEMHGGAIEAHSAGRDQGAEFIVRLPVADEDRAAQGAEAGAHRIARRVLVVDDNRDAAESRGTLLKRMGYEVCLAFDGPTALEAACTYRPDLVLLNIGLPEMSGYDVAQRIREQPELREVVVVAVTGRGQEEDSRRAWEAGYDLIIKDNENILSDLARALNKV